VPLRVKVCEVGDVPQGAWRCFDVAGVNIPIMIHHIEGVHYATSSQCPHETVSLIDGDHEGTKLVCPGHAYEFDIISGECSHDPDLFLIRYPVSVVGGVVYVELLTPEGQQP